MEENRTSYNETPFQRMEYTRPTMLVVLCILTFISSGLNCFSYFFIPFIPEYLSQMSSTMPAFPEEFYTLLDEIALIPSWKFTAIALCCAGSVVGAALMLKLKPVGFHVYAISKLLNILIASFMLAGTNHEASGMSIITTVLIAGLYFIYYYQMKKTEELNNMREEENEKREF